MWTGSFEASTGTYLGRGGSVCSLYSAGVLKVPETTSIGCVSNVKVVCVTGSADVAVLEGEPSVCLKCSTVGCLWWLSG